MFSDRIGRITPSATLAMTAKAAELRSAGVDVINLSVGEPDFFIWNETDDSQTADWTLVDPGSTN